MNDPNRDIHPDTDRHHHQSHSPAAPTRAPTSSSCRSANSARDTLALPEYYYTASKAILGSRSGTESYQYPLGSLNTGNSRKKSKPSRPFESSSSFKPDDSESYVPDTPNSEIYLQRGHESKRARRIAKLKEANQRGRSSSDQTLKTRDSWEDLKGTWEASERKDRKKEVKGAK